MDRYTDTAVTDLMKEDVLTLLTDLDSVTPLDELRESILFEYILYLDGTNGNDIDSVKDYIRYQIDIKE